MDKALQEIHSLKEHGNLKLAGFGSGVTKYVDSNNRGDYHLWMSDVDRYSNNGEKEKLAPSLFKIVDMMKRIRISLNRYVNQQNT